MIRLPALAGLAGLATACSGVGSDVSSPNVPPVAAFASSCTGVGCSFTDASSDVDGRIVSYRWSFGDESPTETLADVRHTYAAPGDYTVGLSVTDDSGETASVSHPIRVVPPIPDLPYLAFSDSAIGFCDSPGYTRNCVRLEEHVLFTSTGSPLAWKATSSEPWILVQPTSGTTDTDVRVLVAESQLPAGCCVHGTRISGSLTVSAAGAGNSPQTIPVKLQFYSSPPPQ